ncbi:MAG: HAD-IA family hydrolase [bacterium]|nr:HAD-IA family hydrolase [bacterium]MDY2830367.1 HAD-IA family hydrolase [Alphaproteobacteria bacterium]
MVLGKNTVIYDLDDTLYNKTEELGDILDTTMAEALVYDLGLKMDIDEVKKLVTQSYKIYRDGGEIFYQNYGIQPKDLFIAYHRRKPVERIVPYHNLLSKIEKVPAEQFIFTASDRYASEKILKHLGLFEFFKDRYYSVEDFGVYKKNEDAQVYKDFCQKINVNPKDCVFVDDSYSNLEFAKEAGMTTVRIYYKNNSAKDKTYIDYAYKGIESFLDDVLGA